MNMKDTVILLIFLLSVLGLLLGIQYSEDTGSDNSQDETLDTVNEDDDGAVIFAVEKKESENNLNKYFT